MLITFNILWLVIYSLFVAIATLGLYMKARSFLTKFFKGR